MDASAKLSRAKHKLARPVHFNQEGAPAFSPSGKKPVKPVQERDERWLGMYGATLRATDIKLPTFNHYTGSTRQFMLFTKSRGLPTAEYVTKEHVQEYLRTLKEGDPDYGERAYPGTTRRNRFLGLRRFFVWMQEEAFLEGKMPMAGLKPPKNENTTKDVVSLEQMDLVYEGLKRQKRWRDLALIGMFYDTGMRVSEVANLLTDQVNVRNGAVKLYGYRDLTEAGVELPPELTPEERTQHTKNGFGRKVQMGPATLKHLLRYWIEPRQKPVYVFNGYSGKGRLTREGIYTIVRCIFAEFIGDKPVIGPHDLRHTRATHARRAGMSTADMMTWFGWQDFKMVKQYSSEVEQITAMKAMRALNIDIGNLKDAAKRLKLEEEEFE